MNILIPLPIPGSIYGFLIMLFCLQFKIIKLEKVKALGDFQLKGCYSGYYCWSY
ncbi:MAG: CidA/LrgA family protein [Tissierellia bacterium]|nr:CidA/LrgA family protein [Tissierellia bacterium]